MSDEPDGLDCLQGILLALLVVAVLIPAGVCSIAFTIAQFQVAPWTTGIVLLMTVAVAVAVAREVGKQADDWEMRIVAYFGLIFIGAAIIGLLSR